MAMQDMLSAATDEGQSNVHSNADASLGDDQEFFISYRTLIRLTPGVVEAAKCTTEIAQPVLKWAASFGPSPNNASFTPNDWIASVDAHFTLSTGAGDDSRHLAKLVVAIALLRGKSRNETNMTQADLDFVWSIIRDALTATSLAQPLCAAMRSSQGFLTVPLCSILKDGNIDELFRLHVWLPNQSRGSTDFSLHSHQPYAQSWILAGEGTDHPYVVEPVDDVEDATHARYELFWSGAVEKKEADNNTNGIDETDRTYKTHTVKSTVRNTQKYVRATARPSETHRPGSTYSMPAASYHTTEVKPDAFHATLFFFDAHRGFVQKADVLGPKHGTLSSAYRDPAGVTPSYLAEVVDNVRTWEGLISEGKEYAHRAEWEQALKLFDKALTLCSFDPVAASSQPENFPNASRCRLIVQGELGATNRRFGRYKQARDILETAIAEMSTDKTSAHWRVEFSGELGVVYRHMDCLEEAKRALQMQYDTAQEFDFQNAACRALGNLGMVNYQLSQQAGRAPLDATKLLNTAMYQLKDRVERARTLKLECEKSQSDKDSIPQLALWESIGLQRLSLCYAASQEFQAGLDASMAAYELTKNTPDATVAAFTRLFLGRALIHNGQREEGLAHLFGATLPAGRCTPIIALCKEPSAEHRSYLSEIISETASFDSQRESGESLRLPGQVSLDTSLDATDENGYTALDYCVFNGDNETKNLIVEALRRQLYERVERELSAKANEAQLRKGYRELFQEKLRPVLLQGDKRKGENDRRYSILPQLRRVYADSITPTPPLSLPSTEVNKDCRQTDGYSDTFDILKFIPYGDFERLGHLPSSQEGVVRRYFSPDLGTTGASPVDFIVFISYTWCKSVNGVTSPDDEQNTQYTRMLVAVEDFLKLHPEVSKERLGLWVDYACVDQSNPMPGISALPMIVAQCNAVISLIDDVYYDRAWCSVEVMMVQTLQRAYGLHYWYEHVVPVPYDDGSGLAEISKDALKAESFLRQGPMDLEIVMSKKDLSYEVDRPKVLFLERQTKLLG